MKQIEGIVKAFGQIVDEAIELTIEGMDKGTIKDETTITNRFLGSLETRINEFGTRLLGTEGITISATTLTDRGRNSEESKFGADFAILLDINVRNFELKKGFICQAKVEGDGIKIEDTAGSTIVTFTQHKRREDLKNQVKKMLDISQDSFVIIYGSSRFIVVPGSSVYGLTNNDSIYGKPTSNFFKEFLMCFIGDLRLTQDPKNWENLKETARSILKIEIKRSDQEENPDKPKPWPLNHEIHPVPQVIVPLSA